MKPSSDLWVNMGLPSGLLWAKKNLDITQANGFAESEFQYACSFVSWGNVEMHNPVSSDAFDYDFGGINQVEPWYVDQVYGSTPGCSIQSDLYISADVARRVAGGPWRMPSTAEFAELFQFSDFIDSDGQVIPNETTDKRTMINGVRGIYLQSRITGARLFFPASGYGHGAQLDVRGSHGFYYTSSVFDSKNSRSMVFSGLSVARQDYSNRYLGCSVRPVWMDFQ